MFLDEGWEEKPSLSINKNKWKIKTEIDDVGIFFS